METVFTKLRLRGKLLPRVVSIGYFADDGDFYYDGEYRGTGMKDIALALGGGGVKGYAHVGVLKVLEKHGFRIRAIAGTSAGGLVGALYASGLAPEEIETELCLMDQNRLFTRLPGDGPAMLGLAGVVHLLNLRLGGLTFADLRLPLAVTAVNLDTAELYALQRGQVTDAVLATIAVPGVFPPREWEGMRLVDGGILDPVPVALASALAPGVPVAAVILSPPLNGWTSRVVRPRLLENMPMLAQYLGRLRVAQAMNIFLRSVDIAGVALTEMKLQADPPDLIIRPTVAQIGFLDNVDIGDVITLGEQAAEEKLADLERMVSWRGWLGRRWNRRTNKPVLLR